MSLKSWLARVALAYALALQALLGTFAGVAAAAGSGSLDPALTLCRTIASDETQQSGDHSVPGSHCAVMCLSGGCAVGEPPTAASAAIEFLPVRVGSTFVRAVNDRCSSPTLRSGLNARGPPSIG